MLALILLALTSAGIEQEHGEHPTEHGDPHGAKPDQVEEPSQAPSLTQIVAHRTASGTAWQPDMAPLYAVHSRLGPATVMLHANVFAGASFQGSDRGDTEPNSINWVMGMASHPTGSGRITGRIMLSAEPLTLGKDGYPLLLQTGETLNGKPLVDRQHPHDLFMEVAALWQQPLTNGIGVELYAAPAGEPALGPVAFPHRVSAINDPVAPLGHHWLDSTHITYGVATAGVFTRFAKLEGSWFNGNEPDENRYDFDLAPFDSYSARLSLAPIQELVFQMSYADLDSPEALEPENSVRRISASTMASWPTSNGGVDAAVAWGRNIEGPRGQDTLATNVLLLESNVDLGRHWALFGRFEHAVKSAHDLALEPFEPNRRFQIHSGNLGVTYGLEAFRSWETSVGLRGNLAFVQRELQSAYGTRVPAGVFAYVQLRPTPMPVKQKLHTDHASLDTDDHP